MASENYLRDFTTRAGIQPDKRELPFTITTSMVEEYIQHKFDIVVDAMNKANRANNTGKTQDRIEVRVYTTEAGGAFVPFVMVLPMEILESSSRKKKQQQELDIFHPDCEDRALGVKKEFYELIKPYVYTKDDQKAFFSDDWRRARKVRRETSPTLKSLSTPKVTSMQGGKIKIVSVLIDPMRIFHDMLVIKDNPEDFKIEIVDWQKLKSGEFKYSIKRVSCKKNKKKYKDTIVDELNRKMRATHR